jgi:hypothetical protein
MRVMEDGMADTEDSHPDETRGMSYGELARMHGISKASAARLAVRRCWTRKAGDDGSVWVAVPISELGLKRPDHRVTAKPILLPSGWLLAASLEKAWKRIIG